MNETKTIHEAQAALLAELLPLRLNAEGYERLDYVHGIERAEVQAAVDKLVAGGRARLRSRGPAVEVLRVQDESSRERGRSGR